MASDPAKSKPDRAAVTPLQVALPALVGWFLPGVGHLMIGDRKRGSIVALGIAGLWLLGLLIGGLSVIDRYDSSDPNVDRRGISLPFLAQVGVAPTLFVDVYHQWLARKFDTYPPAPGQANGFEPSFGRVYEQGVLLTSLAGMLNMMAIIDLLLIGVPMGAREDDDEADSEPAGGGAS